MSKHRASPDHETQSSFFLKRLPPLVRYELFSILSLPDAMALMSASPIFLKQYSLDRASILPRSLVLTLGHVYVDAAAVFESSLPNFQRNRSEVTILQFITSYKSRTQVAATFTVPSNEQGATMAQFHMGTIMPLMDMYADWALSNLVAVVEECVSTDASETAQKQKSSIVMSASEKTRLMRALYRFQLCCNLFGTQKQQDRSLGITLTFTDVDLLAGFFSMFEPWEVEEILCVYAFARDKISHVFDQIDWDINEKNPKFDKERPPTPEGAFDMDNSWMRGLLLQGTISRGLGLVRVLFTQNRSHEELVAWMQKQITQPAGTFLEDSTFQEIPQILRRQNYPSDRDMKEQNRDPLPFEGDSDLYGDGLRPPLAWTLIWGETYSNLYGGYVQGDIRRWGYVMWDAGRLKETAADQALLKQWEDDWDGDDPRDGLL